MFGCKQLSVLKVYKIQPWIIDICVKPIFWVYPLLCFRLARDRTTSPFPNDPITCMFLCVNSEHLGLNCGLLTAVSGHWNLACNFKHFVVHLSMQGISWLWRCMFFIYFATSRLNSSNVKNVSFAYLPTLTSSSYLLWVICSGFVFPLTLQVCLAQQKTCYFILFGIWQENKKNTKKKRIIIVFFPDDLIQMFFLVLLLLPC